LILEIAAGQISIKYGYRGPNYAVVSACASSTHALMMLLIISDWTRQILSLREEARLSLAKREFGGFNAMKALSERNDDPATASRPYDKDRDGFVMGEAAGVLVMKNWNMQSQRRKK